jgi:hypothetical protein
MEKARLRQQIKACGYSLIPHIGVLTLALANQDLTEQMKKLTEAIDRRGGAKNLPRADGQHGH